MHLVSSGKSTILNDFENLDTIYSYPHVNSELTDFQFYGRRRIFVEVNKKCGLEILRVKGNDEERLEIKRVRRMTVENLYCAACTKRSPECIALGLYNGEVKLYNYVHGEFTHRFKNDVGNSVLYLDYNGSDDYLSSVHDNGVINIYGIKTKTKLESINIDSNSTLARFHPTKRFHLAVASYKGSVSIYDIHAKRKYFHKTEIHGAPCRDLCMCSVQPNIVVSVGYDCIINIFDVRQKTPINQLSYYHPFSTVALADCGNYLAVGSLKGELITYDMRNLSSCLKTKKVHDCSVSRIAFLFNESCKLSSNESTDVISQSASVSDTNEPCVSRDNTPAAVADDESKMETIQRTRDSFCDFVDFQASNERQSTRFVTKRDSFDSWDPLYTTNAKDNRNSVYQDRNRTNSFSNSGIGLFDSFTNKIMSAKSNTDGGDNSLLTEPLKDRSNNVAQMQSSKLEQIEEEKHSLHNDSDKENPAINVDFSGRLAILSSDRNSTPKTAAKDVSIDSTKTRMEDCSQLQDEVSQLRKEMHEHFRQLEFNLQLHMDRCKWQIFTNSFNLWNSVNDRSESIHTALSLLLQTDPFLNEYARLQDENRALKEQLAEMAKKRP